MHRYRIEFASSRLDETRLREVLERQLGLTAVTITRESNVRSHSGPPKGVAVELLALLSDNKPWKSAQLIERLSAAYSQSTINAALRRLEERGLVERVRHGIYLAPGAPQPKPAEVLPLLLEASRGTQVKLWELLASPLTAVELREATGVTRQRVEQVLSGWVDQGLVAKHAVAGERAQHVYVRADCEDRQEILTRPPLLTPSRGRLLSALAPEVLSGAPDVADRAAVAQVRMAPVLEELSAQGLVVTFKLTQHRYVGITPRGLAHPEYDPELPKAPPADIVAHVGLLRARFLQVLATLGELRTREITDALHHSHGGRVQLSGQLIQRLEKAGLVAIAEQPAGQQSLYRLTERGAFVTAVVNRHLPPLSAEELTASIRARREARASDQRHRSRVLNPSAPQVAILAALHRWGSLRTSEIAVRMEVKFKDPRSLNLALRTMQQRGLVVGRPASSGRKALVWSVVETAAE